MKGRQYTVFLFQFAIRALAVRAAGMAAVAGASGIVLLALVSACRPPLIEECPVENPIPPPAVPGPLGGGLDGFDSPYLGHTGSWDGKGGGLGGTSKGPDMDLEVAMGLRWTFMPVYWSAMEPDGPVDLDQGLPPAWEELDNYILEAEKRGLNVLMQAPVIGGNAGAPPAWAGVREEGKSAPFDMAAAFAFAGKLAARYRPGGTLAIREGWGESYGVRAWELDNEPDIYRVHWDGQEGDYDNAAQLLPFLPGGRHRSAACCDLC